MNVIRLERAVIQVEGPEARDFLQTIITNDIDLAIEGRAIYAALLTPQGKLLFDFFIVRHEDAYLFDVDKSLLQDFVKRLMFYKLRADVAITPLATAQIYASPETELSPDGFDLGFADPRFAPMGCRYIKLAAPDVKISVSSAQWQAHRIACGLPHGGADFIYGNCFPHDIAMDQLNGISFDKGCYVGQEVVSRMKHRGSARKRPLILSARTDLPKPPEKIKAETSTIGQFGSSEGHLGLAEIRLDRAVKALGEGKTISIGSVYVDLFRPAWADYGEEFEIFNRLKTG